MLIALLTAMLFGGGGDLDVFGKQHQKLVREIVVNEDAADAVVAEMKSTQKTLDQIAKRANKLTKTWRKVDRDRAARGEQLEPLLEEAEGYRKEALDAFTDSIFRHAGESFCRGVGGGLRKGETRRLAAPPFAGSNPAVASKPSPLESTRYAVSSETVTCA